MKRASSLSKKRRATPDSEPVPKLRFERRVTRQHGEAFAVKWLRASIGALDVTDAVSVAAIIAWPGYDPTDESIYTPEQKRLHEIQDEILRRTLRTALPAITAAFVIVAEDVLARERRRQQRRPASP